MARAARQSGADPDDEDYEEFEEMFEQAEGAQVSCALMRNHLKQLVWSVLMHSLVKKNVEHQHWVTVDVPADPARLRKDQETWLSTGGPQHDTGSP